MRIQQLEEEVEEAQANLETNNEKLIKASNDLRKAVDDLNAEKNKIQRLAVGESRSAVPRSFAVFNRRSIVIWKSKSENWRNDWPTSTDPLVNEQDERWVHWNRRIVSWKNSVMRRCGKFLARRRTIRDLSLLSSVENCKRSIVFFMPRKTDFEKRKSWLTKPNYEQMRVKNKFVASSVILCAWLKSFLLFQLDLANIRVRNMKRREDELEDELSRMKRRFRDFQREKDDIIDVDSVHLRSRYGVTRSDREDRHRHVSFRLPTIHTASISLPRTFSSGAVIDNDVAERDDVQYEATKTSASESTFTSSTTLRNSASDYSNRGKQ